MKVEIVLTIERILSGIKINKVQDKEVKSALLKDYLAVRRIAKMVEADRQETIRKFQSDWKEALDDKSKQNEDFERAKRDAADSLLAFERIDSSLYDKSEMEFVKFPSEALYEPDLWAEDILLAQIPGSIDFLIENGVAE